MSKTELMESEILRELKKFDTPSITNVVATYPDNEEICLGLYEPWEIDWYTDETLRCLYPEKERVAGYAVTCVFGMPTPGFKRLTFLDVLRVVEKLVIFRESFFKSYKARLEIIILVRNIRRINILRPDFALLRYFPQKIVERMSGDF